MRFWVKTVLCVATCLAVGAASGLSVASAVGTWYDTLEKPSFNPPNWLFGPVWTVLYVMMGVAWAYVWHAPRQTGKTAAVLFFLLQLLLNAGWSVVFFGLKAPDWALLEMAVLWLAIYFTILRFWKISPVAAWLMSPYLAWVSFAAVLNGAIWWLNH